jgi:hypothetical protein
MMFAAPPAPAIAAVSAIPESAASVPTEASIPPETGSASRGAIWLIAAALLVIAGLLGWLALVLKRLVNAAHDASTRNGGPEPAPVASSAQAVMPIPQPAARRAESAGAPPADEHNVDHHSTAVEFASEGFHGVLRKVGLQDLIQMECLNQRSSVLEIVSKKISGRIYMERGEILHATAGKYSGEKAFIKLFSLRSGEFNLKPFELPAERTINCHWIHLLLEAARQRDEDTVRLTRDKLAFSRSSTNTEDILEMAAMLADHPQVGEILVCSNEGKTLYNSKCRAGADRARLCLELLGVARSAAALLPLGELDQIEILRPESKTLIRGDQECHLLIGMETTLNA